MGQMSLKMFSCGSIRSLEREKSCKLGSRWQRGTSVQRVVIHLHSKGPLSCLSHWKDTTGSTFCQTWQPSRVTRRFFLSCEMPLHVPRGLAHILTFMVSRWHMRLPLEIHRFFYIDQKVKVWWNVWPLWMDYHAISFVDRERYSSTQTLGLM